MPNHKSGHQEAHQSFVIFGLPLGVPQFTRGCDELLPLLVGKVVSPKFSAHTDSVRGASKGPLGGAHAA